MIKRLDKLVASRIAAGEVCERPINAIKELIENSIDAQATDISIEILDGGLSLIKIIDNGTGIEKDDLPLAIERFATSKAVTLDDVYSASTFGFRGEALAAISSVSDFTIQSGIDSSSIYELKSLFGEVASLKPSSGNRGTTITLLRLFENFPARRKFLKSSKSLESEIIKFIKSFSLLNDNITIKLIADKKVILDIKSEDDVIKKASNIFKNKSFFTGSLQKESVTVKATITKPDESDRLKRDAIIIGVNGRVIQDKVLTQAVIQSYFRKIPEGRFPYAIIDIKIDAERVDSNVHPAKLEVRFQEPSKVFSTIVDAINLIFKEQFGGIKYDEKYAVSYEGGSQKNNSSGGYTLNRYLSERNEDDSDIRVESKTQNLSSVNDNVKEDSFINNRFIKPLSAFLDDSNSDSFIEDIADNEYSIVGQIAKTFIVIEKGNEILFIDQHVAHERILYERQMENINRIKSSIILHEAVKMFFDKEIIDDIFSDTESLTSLGFTFERLDDNHIKIISIPSELTRKDIELEFKRTVSELFNSGVTKSSDRRVLSLSCKKAIKAGDRLSDDEISYLIDELLKCKNNRTCPHGRPITYSMKIDELSAKFHR